MVTVAATVAGPGNRHQQAPAHHRPERDNQQQGRGKSHEHVSLYEVQFHRGSPVVFDACGEAGIRGEIDGRGIAPRIFFAVRPA